jgi:hypothetical protein
MVKRSATNITRMLTNLNLLNINHTISSKILTRAIRREKQGFHLLEPSFLPLICSIGTLYLVYFAINHFHYLKIFGYIGDLINYLPLFILITGIIH